MLLSALIITGCVTTKKTEIVLPPMPQRESVPEVTSTKDFARLVNYYEHLVQEWEQWGSVVEEIVGK